MVIMFGEIRNPERGAGVGKECNGLNLRYLLPNL